MHHTTRRRVPSPRRLRGRWAVLSAAVACVLALGAGGTAVADIIMSESPPTQGKYRVYRLITAKHSGLNLNVPAASTENGTQVIQWDGDAFMNGQWEWLPATNTSHGHSIRNRWSRQCLDVDSKTDGAPVVQRPCDGSPSQQWWQDTPKGSFLWAHIVNIWSGLDLNVVGASTAPGAKVMQFHRVPGASNTLFNVTWPSGVVD